MATNPSGGLWYEQVDGGLGSGHHDGSDPATVGCDMIAMTSGNLANQVVCPEQAKLATDGAGSTAVFLDRFRGSRVKQRLQVPVAQTVDRKFSSANDFQQEPVRIVETRTTSADRRTAQI